MALGLQGGSLSPRSPGACFHMERVSVPRTPQLSHGEWGPAPTCLVSASEEDVRPQQGVRQAIAVPGAVPANAKHV